MEISNRCKSRTHYGGDYCHVENKIACPWGRSPVRRRRRPRQSPRTSVYVPLLTYRTGAFAGSGIHIADGMRDYLTMLNERDGGIGGVKLVLEECETGYDTKKGIIQMRIDDHPGC